MHLNVVPGGYPAPPVMEFLQQVLGVFQMVGLGLLMTNSELLPREMRENKVYSFLAIWMGGSMVSQMLVKSNAFEVYKGQDLVWSSLKKGRTPNFNDIVSGFAKVGVEIIPPQRR